MDRPSKEHILREIRRLADENGGNPVGQERFEVASGVREWHWSGKYWARWSDAIREAGYEPNAWQSQVLTDDELLHQLALATRDLGTFPTRGELGLRRRTVPDLAIAKTFVTRLGNQREQINRLLAYCDVRPEFADVAAICAALPGRASISIRSTDPADPSVVTGVVYLIRMAEFYKIGKSNDAGRRMYEIGLRLPEKHDVVHVIETDDPSGIEAYWHRRFTSQRANGEWFRLAPVDVAAFRRRTYM